MQGLPTELIYVLLFAAIVLFQYMMKRLTPQPKQDPGPQEPFAQSTEEMEETPASSSVLGLAGAHFGRAEAPSASVPLPRRRFSRKSLMGTKREVQNAMVIATLLGPCRAFEPHDVR